MIKKSFSFLKTMFGLGVLIGLIFSPLTTSHAGGTNGAASSAATILPATVLATNVPAGAYFKIQMNWQATHSLAQHYKVFVHLEDAQGRMVAQADHEPDIATDSPDWRGKISYAITASFPTNTFDGDYRVVAGLYDKGDRVELLAAPGVKSLPWFAYEIGVVHVDHTAPKPRADTEGALTLDLTGYKTTFEEKFTTQLDVSPHGPGTRWTAHTPWNGDFGDAAFADPTNGFPFTISNGVLRIEARKEANGRWRAGLLASNDREGHGFSQQYGYFEMRAKLPAGDGVWPAFWLSSSPVGASPNIEIDVMEFYGDPKGSYMSTVHVWKPGPHRGIGHQVVTRPLEASDDFHRYGVMVTAEWITMYFDGVEVWKTKTPLEHQRPLMLLLNLALGGGWPIEHTPNPSFMDVDYVRVYAK